MRVIVIPAHSTTPELREVDSDALVCDVVDYAANHALDAACYENMVIEEAEAPVVDETSIIVQAIVFGQQQELTVPPGTTVEEIRRVLNLDQDARVTLRGADGSPVTEATHGTWVAVSASKVQGA